MEQDREIVFLDEEVDGLYQFVVEHIRFHEDWRTRQFSKNNPETEACIRAYGNVANEMRLRFPFKIKK